MVNEGVCWTKDEIWSAYHSLACVEVLNSVVLYSVVHSAVSIPENIHNI